MLKYIFQTPGKEGGTWVAVDKSGRIGVLTNISTGKQENEGKGRGQLVVDFLKSDQSTSEFLEALANEDAQYNPFNICLIEPDKESSGAMNAHYYCRGKAGHVIKTDGPKILEPGFYGLSNSPLSNPFQKRNTGWKSFSRLFKTNPT